MLESLTFHSVPNDGPILGLGQRRTRRFDLTPLSSVTDLLQANGMKNVTTNMLVKRLEGHYLTEKVTKLQGELFFGSEGRPWVRPEGVYHLFASLSAADNLGHAAYADRMRHRLLIRCSKGVPDMPRRSALDTVEDLHRVLKGTKATMDYRVANARDTFKLPEFGKILTDLEIAAMLLAGKTRQPCELRDTMLRKAANLELHPAVDENGKAIVFTIGDPQPKVAIKMPSAVGFNPDWM